MYQSGVSYTFQQLQKKKLERKIAINFLQHTTSGLQSMLFLKKFYCSWLNKNLSRNDIGKSEEDTWIFKKIK